MEKEILKLIKPSKAEKKEIEDLAKKIISSIKIPDTKVELGGSLAKNTWLRGSHDIDIYVKFNKKKYSGEDISDILEKKIKKLKPSKVHGSRDYFQIEKEKYTIELIPIIDIKKPEQAENITDISPLHVKFVKKHSKFTDDIRLAKAFCKANEIYGAESYIRGLSGYAVEVLTINYGGFNKFLKVASEWKEPVIIDIFDEYKGQKILTEMNPAKTRSPIILVDPVQKERNVTAVVDREKFKLLKKTAKKYLKKPSISYFLKQEFELKATRSRFPKKDFFVIHIQPLKGKNDVVGAKLLKVYKFILKNLKKEGFTIKESGWNWDEKATFWYAVKKETLSKTIKHYGPPKSQKNRIKNFKEKWGKIRYEKDTSYVIIDRPFREAKDLIRHLLKDEYVKSRTKKTQLRAI